MSNASKLNVQEYHTGKKNDQAKKAIVFLHGACSSSSVWEGIVSSNQWEEEYRLITIDLPGHGESEKSSNPEKEYTLKGLATLIISLIEEEWKLSSYILVGNSLATNVITEALQFLKNCNGVFLTSASLAGGEIGLAQIAQPNPNLGLVFVSDEPSEEAIMLWANDIVTTSAAIELKRKLAETYRRADPKFRITMGNAVGNGEWSNEIAIINQQSFPVAIIYGEDEKFLNINYLGNAIQKLWHGKVIIIPNASHLLPIDQPEILTKYIIEYAGDCFK